MRRVPLLFYKFWQLAAEQQFQRTAYYDPLLATGRQTTADPTEYYGPFNGSKAAGYLMLNLGHPNIVFTPIIGKRDLFIFHKSEAVVRQS